MSHGVDTPRCVQPLGCCFRLLAITDPAAEFQHGHCAPSERGKGDRGSQMQLASHLDLRGMRNPELLSFPCLVQPCIPPRRHEGRGGRAFLELSSSQGEAGQVEGNEGAASRLGSQLLLLLGRFRRFSWVNTSSLAVYL